MIVKIFVRFRCYYIYRLAGVFMAWFFTQDNISGDRHIITGEDAKHISKVLRMNRGEELTLVTPDLTQCTCEVFSINSDSVTVEVLKRKNAKTSLTYLSLCIRLCQRATKWSTLFRNALSWE